MAPTTLSVTVAATVTPLLEPEQVRDVGARLADILDGRLVMTNLGEDGWASWSVSVQHDEGDLGNLVSYAESITISAVYGTHDDAGVDEDTIAVHVQALEVLTQAEVERRLRAHGVPSREELRGRPQRELPPIPEVVTTTQFAEMCNRTPQRIRQLRAERQRYDQDDDQHPFPAEVFPGHWLRTDAENFVLFLQDGAKRPGTGRRRVGGASGSRSITVTW